MTKQFAARRLDVRAFADEAGLLESAESVRSYPRLLAETQGRGPETPVEWAAQAELRNPRHVHPEVWLHLKAGTSLSLTCQRCLNPVDVPIEFERSFRFVSDEASAAAEDEASEEDVLALSQEFDVIELVEDELLMELPLAPSHDSCAPIRLEIADEGFEGTSARHENPFAALGQLKAGAKPAKE